MGKSDLEFSSLIDGNASGNIAICIIDDSLYSPEVKHGFVVCLVSLFSERESASRSVWICQAEPIESLLRERLRRLVDRWFNGVEACPKAFDRIRNSGYM